MGNPEYAKALKAGQKAYRSAAARGEYPYLPALDEVLERVDVQTEVSLGLVDIPLDQIVGTRTVGRKNAFAANFMPLMPESSEFAYKWGKVYEYQEKSGVSDPVIAYEFMNRFYVQEGNKRVSVLKYLKASSIEGTVTRIIPKPSGERENRIYYEFLKFYKNTSINYLWFSKTGSFDHLNKVLGKTPEEPWSEEERQNFDSAYTQFQKLFEELGGKRLSITTGDAFLFYLSLYPYRDLAVKSRKEEKEELERIWSELLLLNYDPEEALVLEPAEDQESGLFSRFFKSTSSRALKVCFIHDRSVGSSSWTYGHELGRAHLEQVFGSRIQTSSYFMEKLDCGIQELLEQVIGEGCHIIFTAHQKFSAASLKAALEHPEVKILNCSVNRPYSALRTYYGRMYEAKFLGGMIAGAMSENDKIAYAADYPIYGTCANINAFALGARMINPRAKIYLHWLSDERSDLESLIGREKISLISDTDMIRPDSKSRRFGIYERRNGEYIKLATPIWDWGKFYEKIIRDILKGNWSKSPDGKERKAVNYWWGISGNIIDLIMSQNLAPGIRKLTDVMRQEIYTERFHPFYGLIRDQHGELHGRDERALSPEEIITMDWLAENVVGELPEPSVLTEEARTLMMLQKTLSPAGGVNG